MTVLRTFATATLILLPPLAGCASRTPGNRPGSDLSDRLVGSWEGYLQYRDYTSDKYVRLPMKLDAVRIPGRAGAMRWEYTYDDGPGKTVTSSELVAIDRRAGTVTLSELDGKESERFDVIMDRQDAGGREMMVLRTMGSDDNRPATSLKTLTVQDGEFSILKLVQFDGAELEYRNHFTVRRSAPAADAQP